MTDRNKLGSKIYLITVMNGLPLSLGVSGANMYDSQGLEPLVRGIPPVRSRRGPRRPPARETARRQTNSPPSSAASRSENQHARPAANACKYCSMPSL